MKIGVVCPYDIGSPGGVQQLSIELAEQLRALGDEVVHVVGGGPDRSGTGHSFVPVGKPLFVRGNDSRVPITLSPLAWGRVRSALEDVDVIHIHEPLIPLIGWFALTVDRPTVATFHAAAPSWVPPVYRWLPFVGSRMHRSVVSAVSKTAAAAIPDHWGPVTTVPNAIDVAQYRVDVERMPQRVAFLGRDEPRKGLDILLAAWSRIRAAVPDAELVAMGPQRETSIDGVTFRGRVDSDEKARLLASSSVFVAPNTGGESFGMVLLEGMAAGCAVVASDIASFQDVIEDNGAVFRNEDPDALAELVVDLLTNDAKRDHLASMGGEHVAKFDWSVVTERYRQLYERAVS